jgi:hypothetical protein
VPQIFLKPHVWYKLCEKAYRGAHQKSKSKNMIYGIVTQPDNDGKTHGLADEGDLPEVKNFYNLVDHLHSIKQKGVPSRHSPFTKERLMLRLRLTSLYSACTPKQYLWDNPRASRPLILKRTKNQNCITNTTFGL